MSGHHLSGPSLAGVHGSSLNASSPLCRICFSLLGNQPRSGSFPMKDWIAKLLDYRDLAGMGHLQRVEDANLGLGWIYYGLAPSHPPETGRGHRIISWIRSAGPGQSSRRQSRWRTGHFHRPIICRRFLERPAVCPRTLCVLRCDQYRTLPYDHAAVHPIGGLSFPWSPRDGVRGWVSLRGAGSFRLRGL